MRGLLFRSARLAVPGGVIADGWLATEGTGISALGAGEPEPRLADGREEIDLGGDWLLPGFIDVHVHGAIGHETMDADVDGLAAMAGFYAVHGVTGFLATTWTAPEDELLAALTAVRAAMSASLPGARILGAHMEGPFLSPERPGAQDPRLIRPADPQEAGRYFETGVVRLVTIAPEVGDNLRLVEECVRRGVTASAGHTNATYDELVEAVVRGVSHFAHAYNAMRGLHHREPGGVGAALLEPGVTAELIADRIHVHPAALALALLVRGIEGTVLVTDAIRPAGMPAGTYAIGDRTVTLDNGAVRLRDGTLAGSALTADRALRNLAAASGRGVGELWPVSSRNPARVAGLGDRKGELVAGKDADLVVLTADLTVRITVVEGAVVHRSPPEGSLRGSGPWPQAREDH